MFAGVLLIVVMLNLVISVISDNYDNVMVTMTQSDYKMKCVLLQEYATIAEIY